MVLVEASGGIEGGVSFTRPTFLPLLMIEGSMRGCIDVVILAGCWGQG